MAYKINIRNAGNTAWVNLLEAQYIEVLDANGNFYGTTVESILEELFDNKVRRVVADGAPGVGHDGTSGYPMGTLWVDPDTDKVYISVNENTGAAIWIDVSSIDQEGIEDTVGNMFPGANTNIVSAYNDSTGKIDLTVATATASVLGVASFPASDFDVTAGAVTIAAGAIAVTELASGIDATAIGFDAAKVNGTSVLDSGTSTSDLWTANKIQSYVDSIASGLQWQESVISMNLDAAPGSPSTGDRYVVSMDPAPATGAWVGHDNEVAEWDGAAWEYTTVAEGFALWNEEIDTQYVYNGTDWAKIGTTVTHENLIGLQGDSATELYHLTSAQHGAITGSNASTLVFASPENGYGVGAFRALISDDIPSLFSNKITNFTEAAQDAAGALITAGTATNMTATYDDASNAINFAIPAATVSTLGVASFDTSGFSVTAGAVSLKAATTGALGVASFNSSQFSVTGGAVSLIDGGGLDHGDLAGLGDDDHSQYVHNSIARTITAQHTFNPAGQPQAPFVLGGQAQKQLVVDFNADLLNGQDWTVAATASAPATPEVNDIWVEITA
jgi:hypothetical protein